MPLMAIKSRRRFLALLGAFPIISDSLFFSRRPLMVAKIGEGFVLVRGWILMENDLPEDYFR